MKCKNCRAWEKREDEPKFGYCKRHAPIPTITAIIDGMTFQIIWPSTGEDDCCMEFLGNEE